MKILAIEKELKEKDHTNFEPHLKSEALNVWELVKDDIIREIYFDALKHTAVIILECESVEVAKNVLTNLPLVREKFITFEFIPLTAYNGFERLFMK